MPYGDPVWSCLVECVIVVREKVWIFWWCWRGRSRASRDEEKSNSEEKQEREWCSFHESTPNELYDKYSDTLSNSCGVATVTTRHVSRSVVIVSFSPVVR